MTDILIALDGDDAWAWLADHPYIPVADLDFDNVGPRLPNLNIVTRPDQLRGIAVHHVTWTGSACLEHPDFMVLHRMVRKKQAATRFADAMDGVAEKMRNIGANFARAFKGQPPLP